MERCELHRISLIDGECIACTRGTANISTAVICPETVTVLPKSYFLAVSTSLNIKNKVVAEHDKQFPGRKKRESIVNHFRRMRGLNPLPPVVQNHGFY